MAAPTLTPDARTDARAPAWIACRSATRSVVDGVVICPEGSFSPWLRCLECRHLEAAEDDRDRECGRLCQPADPAAEARIEPPLEGWAPLVVELL